VSRARNRILLWGLALVVLIAGIAIFALRRRTLNAKLEQGREAIFKIAQAVARCSTPSGNLPKSSKPVPADASLVSGRAYASRPDDWSHEAFACARFEPAEPQFFQYQWVRESDSGGFVRALADFDGDGNPETRLELDVVCSAHGCRAATELRSAQP
jgi:hypothetical protein